MGKREVYQYELSENKKISHIQKKKWREYLEKESITVGTTASVCSSGKCP